ncbi:MAG: tRNA epoxyqueuosine(34) reductase QueG [Bacteroidota bacterium]|nr:tRNA epoxyqueuosine(34) reductase QueG [Bacteroidota bacterium]
MTKKEKSEKIKKRALELGFDKVGIVKAELLQNEKENFDVWLKNNFNAEMNYMERNVEKRLNPTLLVEKSKSIIIVLKNYFPSQKQVDDTFKISKYAFGNDYHDVLKADLHKLFTFINNEIEFVNGRIFVDSAPVLEKKWAQKANLGWIGKNSLLLTKKGSFFFIAEIILDIELDYNEPEFNDYCGSCTNCIDACPTKAIVEPYVVNSNLCISYLTIEKKGEFENNFELNFEDYIFGCDICQDVCPWNKKAVPHDEELFEPHFLLTQLKKTDWKKLTKETFDTIFKHSAVKRTKYNGLMRNIDEL